MRENENGVFCHQSAGLDAGFDQAAQPGQRLAAVAGDLAAQQVHGLNAIGPLMNRVKTVIPIMLFHRVLTRVAVTAEYLDRQFVRFQTPVRGPCLDERRHRWRFPERLDSRGTISGAVGFVDVVVAGPVQVRSSQ